MGQTFSKNEFEIYSSLTKTQLFRFDIGSTTFDDYTGVPSRFQRFTDKWDAPFIGKAKYICAKKPEILEDFSIKNSSPHKIEPAFFAEYGFQSLSERKKEIPPSTAKYFRVSRVGFSSDAEFALIYIEYIDSCGYWVVFRKASNEWEVVATQLTWVC